ncbi:hypothetical protein ACJJTC_012742 [Scirpophaga incertulas]
MSQRQFFYQKAEDKDLNYDELLHPCFQIDPEVVLKDVPTTPEEFLLKGIKEREKHSFITKCNKDISKYAEYQSRFVELIPTAIVSEKIKPTKEWQNIQVADFSDVRMYLSRLRAKKSQWPNLEKIDIINNTLKEWKNFFLNTEPTLKCVLGLSVVLLDQGLVMLTKILDETKHGYTIDHKIGRWIYALLACLRQPLLSDTISILRDLARKCNDIRSRIDPEDPNATVLVMPFNIFICIVARYFSQLDLAD